MPTVLACLRRSVERMWPRRVPTRFGPPTRLRRPKNQWNQGPLATQQAEMCPRTANSGQSWRELLLRLRDENGLVVDPELATGDGALGFWQALHEVWPKTRQQRCWVHKAANVLNKLPRSLQGKAKQDLHAIYEA